MLERKRLPMTRRVISRYEDVICTAPQFVRERTKMSRPDTVRELLMKQIGDEAAEVFVALLLDARHRCTGFIEVGRGTKTLCPVHPLQIFGPALRLDATAVIVGHNHPSGDSTPSTEDIDVTRRLIKAGEVLGIPVLDHVIIGSDGNHTSLRESGRISW